MQFCLFFYVLFQVLIQQYRYKDTATMNFQHVSCLIYSYILALELFLYAFYQNYTREVEVVNLHMEDIELYSLQLTA